jgi:hypothetical protein
VNTLIVLASALLPSSVRSRYREQWLADLRDAAGAGLSGGSIVAGAVKFGLTYRAPRSATGALPANSRRVWLGFVLLAASAVTAVGLGLSVVGSSGNAGLAWAILESGEEAIVGGGFLGGLVFVLVGAIVARSRLVLVGSLLVFVGGPLTASGVLSSRGFPFPLASALAWLAGMSMLAIWCLRARPDADRHAVASTRRQRVRSSVIGLVLAVIVCAYGLAEALVRGVLNVVQGQPLDAIYAAVGPRLPFAIGILVVWAVVILGLAIAWSAFGVRSTALSAQSLLTGGVALAGLGVASQVVASAFFVGSITHALHSTEGVTFASPYFLFAGQLLLTVALARSVAPGRAAYRLLI